MLPRVDGQRPRAGLVLPPDDSDPAASAARRAAALCSDGTMAIAMAESVANTGAARGGPARPGANAHTPQPECGHTAPTHSLPMPTLFCPRESMMSTMATTSPSSSAVARASTLSIASSTQRHTYTGTVM